VLGASSSFLPVIVPRPTRRFPDEHSDPHTEHLGTWYAASKTAICAPPAARISTGTVADVEIEPLFPDTMIDPVPLWIEDAAVTVIITVETLVDIATVDGDEAQVIPDMEEPQSTLALPEYPPTPYMMQLNCSVEEVWPSLGIIKESLLHSNSIPGPAAGVTAAQSEEGPQHASLLPFGTTM
jgi:hypothetical protein